MSQHTALIRPNKTKTAIMQLHPGQHPVVLNLFGNFVVITIIVD